MGNHLHDTYGTSAYQTHGIYVNDGPGTYELSIARRGGKPFVYQRIGTITTPLRSNTVLAAP